MTKLLSLIADRILELVVPRHSAVAAPPCEYERRCRLICSMTGKQFIIVQYTNCHVEFIGCGHC
ncbi:hypothetical protein WEH80_37105 [Actinomycetes bacterium KLBMP 9759]